jgi:hypothetical protein
MAIRVVGVDLDGTLLNSQSEISPANRRAIQAAIERGAQVVVATGRRLHSARKYVEQIPCPVTVISSNGALITSPSGEVLRRNFLPRAVARQVLQIARDFRPFAAALFDVPGRGQIVVEHRATPRGPLGWYLKQSAEYLAQVDDLESVLTTDPIQVLFGGPPAEIEPVERLLAESPLVTQIQMHWTKYLTRDVSILDVMNYGCSKGAALAFCAEQWGVKRHEVMAIGDNHNDQEMLEYAGVAVLMDNSSPGLGRQGWQRTLSNDQDGVAAAIQSYVLG